jgi:hypothetical protein
LRSSRRIRLLRHALVVAEIAGAVVLLIGAALLIRSFWRLQHVDPGVDVDHVLTARLTLPRTRYSSQAESAAFFQRLVDRLAALPGVQAAGATSFVPIGGGGFGLGRVFLAATSRRSACRCCGAGASRRTIAPRRRRSPS